MATRLRATLPGQLALLLILIWPAILLADWTSPPGAGVLEVPGRAIGEASGLARSQRRPDLFWTQNDSGGDPELYAIDTTGRHRATLRLTGEAVVNFDWEDVTSFRRHGVAYLLVADTGDNYALRDTITCYLLREPALTGRDNLRQPVERSYTLRYPDGPRDVEAIAVDAAAGQIYVISKRGDPPRIYRFDLDQPATPDSPGVMTLVGTLNLPPQEPDQPGPLELYHLITTMDFSDAGDRAYVGSLRSGYLYRREPGETWAEALAQAPRQIRLPASLAQIEGGAFATGSSGEVWVISEGLPTRMARVQP